MLAGIVAVGLIALVCATGWLYAARTSARHRREHEELRQSLGVVDVDRRVLELVASGATVQAVLDALTSSIEGIATASRCTILLLDEDGRHLRKGAGPSLPASYMDAVDGLEIGPDVGACGTAAFHNQTVIIEDVATDYRFATAKDLVMGYGLRSCWSVPIRDSKRQVLGTFAMYHRWPARPRENELRLVEAAAHLAGNAIERLRAEQRLASVAERLELAERAAAFGLWEYNIQSREVTVSAGLTQLLGWSTVGPHVDLQVLAAMVHAGDRARFDAALEQAFATGHLREEFRIELADGCVRWVRCQARIQIDAGVAHRAVGILIDISEERALLARIQRESDRLAVLQQASTLLAAQTGEPEIVLPDILRTAVQLVNGDCGSLFRWDEAAGVLRRVQDWNLGEATPVPEARPGEGLVGQTFLRLAPVIVNDYGAWEGRLEPMDSAIRAGLAVPLVHRGAAMGVLFVAIDRGDDRVFDQEDARFASLLADQVAAAFFVGATLQQQRYAAVHDALTGLPNRVLLNERLEDVLASAQHRQAPTALLLMDLDHFKDVNDALGHPVGDELLQEVSRRLAGALRDTDLVARLGGDEFAFLLPDTDARGAEAVARHVLELVKQPIRLGTHVVNVGASIGLALYPDHARTKSDLMSAADVAMYAAKTHASEFAIAGVEPRAGAERREPLAWRKDIRRAS